MLYLGYFNNGTDYLGCYNDNGVWIEESFTNMNWTLDCYCNATFAADPDIGGIGVR